MKIVAGEKKYFRKEFILRFARVITGLFIVLSIQLLLYLFYLSEIVSHGLKNDIYLKYYLVLLFVTIFWVWVFRLKDKIKLNIILVTTSLVAGIYLAEICFHFFGSVVMDHSTATELRSAAAKAVGKKYNTQTKRQVYLTLKHKGLDVIPSVHPSELFAYTNGIPGGDSLYPLGGISGKIPSIVMKMENTPFLKAIVMVLIIQI